MTNGATPTGVGWFEGLEPDDLDGASAAITEGEADEPRPWPTRAVESGFVGSESEYYERLHDASLAAARTAVHARERATDRQLVHAIRARDDAARTANELAERVEEWAGTLFDDLPGDGVDVARAVAARDATTPAEERVVSLAQRVVDLADEADELRSFVETHAPTVAPNLSEMAGPVLAARLISLAGGLDRLAKRPSGTVQVLGAEDALFAHLRGHASSPKHGIIYTHEFVHGTRPEDRGSAARALAGKLSLAARADHYAGERRPKLHDDLAARMRRIRARAEDGGGDGS